LPHEGGGESPHFIPLDKNETSRREAMQGLDAHYSALWVANERRLDAQSRPQKFTVTVAIEGYVEVEIEASSQQEAEASAREKVALEAMAYADLMTVTDITITDSEETK
jgi:hypothetical protein